MRTIPRGVGLWGARASELLGALRTSRVCVCVRACGTVRVRASVFSGVWRTTSIPTLQERGPLQSRVRSQHSPPSELLSL